MVSFQCNSCGDTCKKPQLKKHRCHGAMFTCIDCSTTLPAQNNHTSCISEAEKYQKTLYQDKKKGKGQNGQPQPNKPDGATVDLSSNGSAVVDISKLTANNQANGSSAAPTPTESQPAASTETTQQPPESKAKKEKEATASKKSGKKTAEPSKAQDATPATAAEQPASKPEEAKAAPEEKPQEKKKEKKSKKAQTDAAAEPAAKAEEPAATETSQTADAPKADEESDKKEKRERKRKRKSGAASEEARPESEAETSKQANGAAPMQVDDQTPAAPTTEAANADEDKSAKKKQKKSRKSETAAEAPANGTTAATEAPKPADDKEEKAKSKKSRKSVTAAGPAAVSDIDPAVVQATAKSLKSVFSMNGLSKRGSDLAAHVKSELEKSEDPIMRAAAVAEGVVHRAILQATKITQNKSGLAVTFEA